MTDCRDITDHAALTRCADDDNGLPHCHDEDLPADPFLALRVAFGMLLGEDDFRVLMGNPRGKQMLHTSWLHGFGPGVLWGYNVTRDGDGLLVVDPGLAVDGIGRELRLEARQCLDLASWSKDWIDGHPPAAAGDKKPPGDHAGKHTVVAWVVAEFDSCADRAVPALTDPCDVSRKHDSFSRIVETVRIVVRETRPPRRVPYRRLRVLLGLERGDPDRDQDTLAALDEVREAPPYERPHRLLQAFRFLAARDVVELRPAKSPDEDCLPQFPVAEDDAGVVLARLSFEIDDEAGCVRIGKVSADPDVRTALLPTSTIQELLCAAAPGVIGQDAVTDAGGPRLDPLSVQWTNRYATVAFAVDKPVAPGSWERAIEVSSLSESGRGWRREHIDQVRLEAEGRRVRVDLDGPPAYPTARLVVRGTGPTPLFGVDPRVPFAGVRGGPPGTKDDGHDAAITTYLDYDAAREGAES